jgi:hypothetical protein
VKQRKNNFNFNNEQLDALRLARIGLKGMVRNFKLVTVAEYLKSKHFLSFLSAVSSILVDKELLNAKRLR